jgi:hypothetical protein
MFVLKDIAVAFPEQILVGFGVGTAVGVGLTVITKMRSVPEHAVEVDKDGLTFMFAIIGAVVLFVAVNIGILPFPLAASPIAVLSFTQEKLVDETAPEKAITLVLVLLQ